MNTVPSGRFDFCMYGALAVGGTLITGATQVVDAASVSPLLEELDSVGRLVVLAELLVVR